MAATPGGGSAGALAAVAADQGVGGAVVVQVVAGRRVELTEPLPPELQAVLDRLRA